MNTLEQGYRRPARQTPTDPGDRPGNNAKADDLGQGQIVIVTARWILVLSALLIALWSPGKIGELRLEIVVIILLAVANFYLHAQLLMRRTTLDQWVVYGASLGDLAVITAIVAAQGGFSSNVYIFYYPAVLAFSVAFPRQVNVLYTAATVVIYATLALLSVDPSQQALSTIFVRVLMLAGVSACGTVYWWIERDRRQAASRAQEALLRPA